ncbi:hypothetical protein J6590_015324 [Homalodisca vitripennis]|nr:hypothetical protein J6590_015324 [Homalodisca vitripennis]
MSVVYQYVLYTSGSSVQITREERPPRFNVRIMSVVYQYVFTQRICQSRSHRERICQSRSHREVRDLGPEVHTLRSFVVLCWATFMA